MKQLNNIISLLLSVYASVAAAAADGDWKREPSKLTVATENRQLGGSKSGKKFFTKSGKRSKGKGSKSKGGESSSSTASRSKQSTNSADSSNETNRDGSDANRIEEGKLSSSDGAILIAPPPDSAAIGVSDEGQGNSSDGANLITTPPESVATGVSGVSGQSENTNSDTDEETMTIFVETEDTFFETEDTFFETEDNKFFETEDSGEYSGLRTQNMIVGVTALLAILATVVGVIIQRKKKAQAEREKNILDSVEISPATAVVRPNKPSSNETAAPVIDADYSCDLFGFNNCLA